jgi:hypothetical protein
MLNVIRRSRRMNPGFFPGAAAGVSRTWWNDLNKNPRAAEDW